MASEPAALGAAGRRPDQAPAYSDQKHVDAQCEQLLRNTKKQVKQMMEEAVTKKVIHQQSSSIAALCVAVDACLAHGLRRRALGLFKTSSSTALVQKVAKSCPSARHVLELVERAHRPPSASGAVARKLSEHGFGPPPPPPPDQQVTGAGPRNLWIKCALLDKQLVAIVEYLADQAARFYEPDALMANHLCAQILVSLLVGPSALEFSRCKLAERAYQWHDDEPSADELLRRHALAKPVACLCAAKSSSLSAGPQCCAKPAPGAPKAATSAPAKPGRSHSRVARSSTAGAQPAQPAAAGACAQPAPAAAAAARPLDSALSADSRRAAARRTSATTRRPSCPAVGVAARRRPLALKSSMKRGTLVTECHHYACQEMSEHAPARGYSILCAPGAPASGGRCSPSGSPTPGSAATPQQLQQQQQQQQQQPPQQSDEIQQHELPAWSPRMLHETLHQNPRSRLLYAKNNVLLETQPRQTTAGYLSLHETSARELILKWIPNQMINGGSSGGAQQSEGSAAASEAAGEPAAEAADPSAAIESSYLELVVSLCVSRIVLLHCQFAPLSQAGDAPAKQQSEESSNETLVLVEADGVQRAPFKFPRGSLRVFLSCLEAGLAPERRLDPALLIDDDAGARQPASSPPASARCPADQQPQRAASLDSATGAGSDSANPPIPASKFEQIIKRLPSLKRRQPPTPATPLDEASQTGGAVEQSSAAAVAIAVGPTVANAGELSVSLNATNCVYRLVTDWSEAQSPSNSLASSSGASAATLNAPHNATPGVASEPGQAALGDNKQMPQAVSARPRWSLSRLARFSAKHTTTSTGSTYSTTSSTMSSFGTPELNFARLLSAYSGRNASSSDTGAGAVDSKSVNNNDNSLSANNDGNIRDVDDQDDGDAFVAADSRQLARVEAKLEAIERSKSDELLALRTQSIQNVCQSMRKQILARTFYGWLAYCRRSKIIRQHLTKLINPNLAGQDSASPPLSNQEAVEEDDTCFAGDNQVDNDMNDGLTRARWTDLMANAGLLSEAQISFQVHSLVYYGGVQDDQLRREVWPYLLEHYKFADTPERRAAKDRRTREAYAAAGRDWTQIERVVKQRDNEILAANIAKASRKLDPTASEPPTVPEDTKKTLCDHTNTDSDAHSHTQPSTGSGTDCGPVQLDSVDEQPDEIATKLIDKDANNNSNIEEQNYNNKETESRISKRHQNAKRRRRRPRLESTGSVGSDASITDHFGNNVHRIDKDVQRCDRNYWYFKQAQNLEKLRNVMCTYVWQHLDVGYVQGMCDLAAPFLVIFDDEVLAFCCFSQLMKRMVANFPHGCAMDQHFESLKYLMQVLDPKLFDVLQNNGDYTHFYFCYRWLLLDFKRELAYADVFRVWETIWSARYVFTDHFVVFLALAMVRFYRDIIIENNMDFTDTIKFFNEMAERHDAIKIIDLARDCTVELQNLITT